MKQKSITLTDKQVTNIQKLADKTTHGDFSAAVRNIITKSEVNNHE